MSVLFNKSYLMKYPNAKTDAAKHSVPGYHYFKKIYSFMDSHCIIGEMFLEYLKGAGKENGESGTLCDFCSTREPNAVRRLNKLRGHFLRTKVMDIITFLCLKPQQTTGLSMITCQGYSWKHNTHKGSAPWMIPPVSRNSQENLLWLRDAWKTIWSIWLYSILRKTKERRKDWLKSQLRQARHTKSMIGMRRLRWLP